MLNLYFCFILFFLKIAPKSPKGDLDFEVLFAPLQGGWGAVLVYSLSSGIYNKNIHVAKLFPQFI